MSLIKNTKIEGDLSVSRNASVGGEAIINGKTKMQSGLTVQGRSVLQSGLEVQGKAVLQSRTEILDNLIVYGGMEIRGAKGLQGLVVCKGFFNTHTALEEAYATPEKGWWAICQDDATTLADSTIYAYKMADKARWVDTGSTLGSIIIEGDAQSEKIDELVNRVSAIEAVDKVQDDEISTLKSDVSADQEEIVKRNGLINVDALCGSCTASEYYTLEYAISAISNRQATTGKQYKKSGLVIVYKTGASTYEVKIFKGNVESFGNTDLWEDFGGKGDEGKADEALQKALSAITASSNAVVVANQANATSKEAKNIANQASATATTASATAETASATASEAKETATEVQTNLVVVQKDISNLRGAVSKNEANITSNTTQIKNNTSNIGVVKASIAEVQTKVATAEATISEHATSIAALQENDSKQDESIKANIQSINNLSAGVQTNKNGISVLNYKQPLSAFYEVISSVSDGTIDPSETAVSGGDLVFLDEGGKRQNNKFYYRVVKTDGTILYYSKWDGISGLPNYYELYAHPGLERGSDLRSGKLIYCTKTCTLYRIESNYLQLVSADLSKIEAEIATKADQTSVDTLSDSVRQVGAQLSSHISEYTKSMSAIETKFGTKADQTSVDTLSDSVRQVGAQLSSHISEYTKSMSAIDTKFGTKANADDVYTKTETDTAMATKANVSDVYTKTEIDEKIGEINSTLEEVLS
jgi:hypothetical protein